MATVQISRQTLDRATKISELTHEAPEVVVASALEEALEIQQWQLEEIAKAAHEAENDGKFASNDDMSAWVNSLGTDQEQYLPKAKLTRKDF